MNATMHRTARNSQRKMDVLSVFLDNMFLQTLNNALLVVRIANDVMNIHVTNAKMGILNLKELVKSVIAIA